MHVGDKGMKAIAFDLFSNLKKEQLIPAIYHIVTGFPFVQNVLKMKILRKLGLEDPKFQRMLRFPKIKTFDTLQATSSVLAKKAGEATSVLAKTGAGQTIASMAKATSDVLRLGARRLQPVDRAAQ